MRVQDLFDLTGKVALITGGGRGLGKQIAEAFGEAGCKVAICSRKLENCEETVSVLRESGIQALAYRCDVTNQEEINRTVDSVLKDCGKIDILVNNSGATWGAPIEEMPLEAWNKVMNVNVTGTFLMSKAVGKLMIERKCGKIINIASAAGLKTSESLNAIGYSTSKAAVIHFTKELARNWAKHGIYVNAIAPGMFPSQMTKEVLAAQYDKIVANIPLGRVGNDYLLKGAALFLASQASDFVTGHILAVEGGSTL
ncbi:SDR family oxidoreductase [Laceyella putida]|uniref:SDR family oxidoreductase n=1 Tax=Laceyella putida TaxID=110101 RepID=A0ABW2RJE8_9BACL